MIGTYPKAKVIGVALNTSMMNEKEANQIINKIEKDTGLPSTDVIRYGGEKIFKELLD